MSKIKAIYLALLMCAILLVASGAFLLLSDGTASTALTKEKISVKYVQSESFCDLLVDPTCQPPSRPPG